MKSVLFFNQSQELCEGLKNLKGAEVQGAREPKFRTFYQIILYLNTVPGLWLIPILCITVGEIRPGSCLQQLADFPGTGSVAGRE